MRIGEAFGLVWEDINLDNKTITINRQVQWHQDKAKSTLDKIESNGHKESGDGYWFFTNPKYNSFRKIDISDSLVALLKREYKRQEAMKIYYGDYYTKHYADTPLTFDGSSNADVNKISTDYTQGNLVNFVCVRNNGTYISSRTLQHTSTVIRNNIFKEFAYHSLRHTHASMLYDLGLNKHYISDRLGHKNFETTACTYIHLTDVARVQGKSFINSLFE